MNSKNIKKKKILCENRFSYFMILSILFHALVLFFIFFNFNHKKIKKYEKKNYVNVSLVTHSEKKNTSVKQLENIKKTDKYIQIKKAVDLSGKKEKVKIKKPKTAFKKRKRLKTFHVTRKKTPKVKTAPEADIKNIISKYKKEIEKTKIKQADVISKEILEYKNEIHKSDKSKSVFSNLAEGAKLDEKINKYRFQIAYEVEKNWALPTGISSSENGIEASIIFKVMSDGKIKDIWFDKKSGNRYFDDSVLRAVEKSDPVSPYPKDVKEKYIPIGLHFTPKGLD